MELRSKLNRALPENFPFYHLGVVSRSGSSEGANDHPMAWADLAAKGRHAVAFAIYGEEMPGTLVLLFDQELDSSVYFEIGNVMASRLADGLGAMPSPPRSLSSKGAERLLQASQGKAIWFEYSHGAGAEKIALELAFIPTEWPNEWPSRSETADV